MNRFFPLVAGLAVLPSASPACDLCAIYSATHAQGLSDSGWSVSLASQFTHFATLRRDGERVPDEFGQRLDSAITQFVARCSFADRFSIQLNVPVISRTFRRPAGLETDRGHERGLGDASVLGQFEVLRRDTEHITVVWDLIGGVKFPTGNTTRLGEESLETDAVEGAPESGVHGHDLTLGTGSTDAILGTNLYLRHGRAFATGFVQYTIRQRGDFNYEFANDLTWEAAPGAYLLLGHVHTLALQGVVSGERKANDRSGETLASDTGITSIFLGPRLTYTYGTKLSAGLGADFPVRVKNTALQLTPDYRLRANVTWNF
jgi:hypothetical protein